MCVKALKYDVVAAAEATAALGNGVCDFGQMRL